jgi:CRP-like cAMP-binding protein
MSDELKTARDGVRRNRTLAGDLDLLVQIADVGGRVELELEDDGRVLALIMPAASARSYSARALTPARAVRALRDELEALAAAGGEKPRP